MDTMTKEQFDKLCWRKVGYKLEDGYEPRVPRRFKDLKTGLVCEINREAMWREGRSIDNEPITIIEVTAVFLKDVHALCRATRQLDQLEEILP